VLERETKKSFIFESSGFSKTQWTSRRWQHLDQEWAQLLSFNLVSQSGTEPKTFMGRGQGLKIFLVGAVGQFFFYYFFLLFIFLFFN
jgi:hypothetical protein